MPKFISMQSLQSLTALMLAALFSAVVNAENFTLPPPDVDLIGEVRVTHAAHDDTLVDIARRYSLGYDQIIKANPGVDRWVPGEGTPIVLPSRYILPDAPRNGIVLNLSEMRLYYYPKPQAGQTPIVITYPVSIGRMDWKTPLGKTSVASKQVNPAWYPPASIKAEHAAEGEILPDVIPGGTPDNPLGHYALRLAVRGYLIHGTDERKAYGIGMRVTHGCVRMYPEDIERLFNMVPVGIPVYIVNQPVKVGWLAGTLFLESHAPLEEDNLPLEVTVADANRALAAKLGPDMPGVDPNTVELVVEQASGFPVPISQPSSY
jgi:L,D-transpeptidase ErfK/SrfK